MTLILPQPADHFSWIPVPNAASASSSTSGADAGGWGPVLQCDPLAAVAPHFFTTRTLQLRGDSPHADRDWAKVASAIGVPPTHLQRMNQVHGCATFVARSDDEGHRARADSPEVDGVVTDEKDVALVVRVADCVPLLIADPRTGAVAAVHAGWRGTAANIASAAVRRLQREYGSKPEDLIAAIGPSIGACCYQVGPEVRDAFMNDGSARSADAWFTPDPKRGDRLRFDGWAANRDQLIAAGLNPANVHAARLCTMTHLSHFYSYRAEGTGTGRLLGVIRRAGAR